MTNRLKSCFPTFPQKVKNQAGFSLIEVMVAVGLLGIIAMATASLFSQLNLSMKATEEKFDVLELRASVLTLLQNTDVCTANIIANAPASVNLTDATETIPSVNTILLNELHFGAEATTPLMAQKNHSLPGKRAGSMVVSSIEVKQIFKNGTGNRYKASFVISFDPSSMIKPLKPISIDYTFTMAASNTFQNCGTSSAGSGSASVPGSSVGYMRMVDSLGWAYPTSGAPPTGVPSCASIGLSPNGYCVRGSPLVNCSASGGDIYYSIYNCSGDLHYVPGPGETPGDGGGSGSI